MMHSAKIIVRVFDGSRQDAEGLLAVERATFNECPYTLVQVQAMLTDGPQRAWLAVGGKEVVGFVIAFPTYSLRGCQWEIDLLAVLPAWRGHGLATRLIGTATAYGAELAQRARAWVASDNRASAHAFSRVGFRTASEPCNLLIYRIEGATSRPLPPSAVNIRETTCAAEAEGYLPAVPACQEHAGLRLLLAERESRPAGYAELVEVQTLLYRGVWIESLVAPTRVAREALIHQIVNRAIDANLEEIGAMVADHNWSLQAALLARGFRSLGDFYALMADLPLPDTATPPGSSVRLHGELADGQT